MQKPSKGMALHATILLSAGLLAAVCVGAEETAQPAGKAAFLKNKCNMCHAVPAAEIEAKTKSEKMKGADLGGVIETDFEVIAAYLRKQGNLGGKNHKKVFKGTDEELQAILDWLASLKTQEQ